MLPIQITIRSMQNSPAIEDHIFKYCKKLSRVYSRTTSIHVVLDTEQKSKLQGKLFSIHIDIAVPGKGSIVCRKHNLDMYIAIRDAFTAAHKLLDRQAKKKPVHVDKHFLYQLVEASSLAVASL